MRDNYIKTGKSDQGDQQVELNQVYPGFEFLGGRILNRYEIFGIREGGFGVVFFVTDVETNQEYAVKTYKPEFAQILPETEEFTSEVEFWIKLDPHPNIVRAYFLEIIEDMPFLFIEYIPGQSASLREQLNSGRFTLNITMGFAYQLCLAMEFANRNGEVAHLDLKPENIFINQNVLKVTDFGLAHRVQVMHGKYPRQEKGSWPYTPPERFLGQPEDSRSDIFAFGLILYEMLTGNLPYPFSLSNDPKLAYKQLKEFHVNKGLKDLTQRLYYEGLPETGIGGISSILNTCLQHYAAERFRDFTQLRELIEFEFSLKSSDYISTDQIVASDRRNRALALFRIGRISDALGLFNRLLVEYPTRADLWLDVAHIYLAIDNENQALHFLSRALDLDSTLNEARELLKPYF